MDYDAPREARKHDGLVSVARLTRNGTLPRLSEAVGRIARSCWTHWQDSRVILEDIVGTTPLTRWVLGFDGNCDTCSRLAEQVAGLSGGVLTVRSLRSPEVRRWRERALGLDAPWAPTLIAVEGGEVRAWTGAALALRLGRLLGPRRLWQVVGIIGELVDSPISPTSPERRRILRRGITGATAAVALLGGAGSHQSPALTRVASAQDEVTSEDNGGNDWEYVKLRNKDEDRMRRKAKDDRDFNIIEEYFANQRDWRAHGNDAVKLNRGNRHVRDAYARHYKAPGDKEWAHVVYGREDEGKEWAYGFLWRNGRYTDKFFVQNGNLRRDNGGRVEAAAQGQPNPIVCAYDAATCKFASTGACVVGTLYGVLFCVYESPGACVALDGVLHHCEDGGLHLDALCREFQGAECQ